MSTRRSRRKLMSEINVVPYIDVMLVLLVIFMITAPLQQNNGVEIDLPVTEGNPIEQKETPTVVITINKEGRYYLSENGTKNIVVSKDDLVLKIVTLHNENQQLQVYIRGDSKVEYGHVVRIMATLKHSGIARIGLITTSEG